MYLFLRNKILQIQPLFLTSLHLSLLGFRNCPYSHGEFPTLFLYFYHLYVSPQKIYGIITFIFNIYTIEEGKNFFFIYPPRLCAWGPRNKLAKDRFTREKQSLLTHMVETQWRVTQRAVRTWGLCSILRENNKFVEKWGDKGKGG